MITLRYLLPALACARVAFATVCSTSATLTIQSAADATALSGCNTFSGSIAIATGTTDDIDLPLTSISENLSVVKAFNISTISSATLQTIGGTFNLQSVHALSTLSFAKLSQVGVISWDDLPALSGLSFGTGISDAKMVTISDTQLTSLNGIALEKANVITLNANSFLRKASFELHSIPSLTLNHNGHGLVLSLPNMKSAGSINLIGVGSLDAPNLQTVKGTFFMQQGSYKEISLPKLESVAQTFHIFENFMLSKISFPQLTTCTQAFVIGQNKQLKAIDEFPKLSTIGGALDFTGTFDVVKLPSLAKVLGAFHVLSTGNLKSSCAVFDKLHQGNAAEIRGQYKCKGPVHDPHSLHGDGPGSTGGGSGGGNGGGSGGSGGNGGSAASSFRPGALVGIAGVLAAVFGMM